VIGSYLAIKKEPDYEIILHPNFYLATTAKCHILAIILMHTKLNALESAMPSLLSFLMQMT
jgi:hypothetical protein